MPDEDTSGYNKYILVSACDVILLTCELSPLHRIDQQASAHMLSHHLTRRSLRVVRRPRRHQSFLVHEPLAHVPSLRAFSQSPSESPRSQLQCWYIEEHAIQISSEKAFHVDNHCIDGKTWWSAQFVCPLTNKVYYADTPTSYADSNSLWFKNNNDVEPINIEGKVWYSKLKTAVQAAAARRLDAIESAKQDNLSSEDSLSTDAHKDLQRPADNLPEEDLPVVDVGSMETSVIRLEKGTDVNDTSYTHIESAPSVDPSKELTKPMAPNKKGPYFDPTIISHPLDHLSRYLSGRHGILNHSDRFEAVMCRTKNGTFWSATFACPVSRQKYVAGSLQDEARYGEIRYLNRVPYYSRRKSALHAAAAKVLDDIQFRETNDVNLPRYCYDDPSHPEVAFVHPQADIRQLVALRDNVSCRQLEEELPDDADNASLVDNIIYPSVSDQSMPMSTLGKVMSAWAKSAGVEKTTTGSSSRKAILPSTWDPLQQRNKICEDATSWLAATGDADAREEIDRTQASTAILSAFSSNANRDTNDRPRPLRYALFHSPVHVNPLEASNAILSALSRANAIKSGPDIQVLADKVLANLSARASPNADTYCAHFRCLHGDSTTVAVTAETTLRTMVTGKLADIKGLPAPTVEVFNTVIELWANAGEPQKCQSVFDLLLNSGFEANRETFYSMLSVMAQGTFDADAAKAVLERLQRIGSVDAEVYCAPLRWSGRQMGTGTVPWDRFSEIYSDGFKESAIEGSYEEAQAVDAWVSSMQDVVEVNTTSGYEATIQAWVRTGTLEGLLRAEACAQQLLAAASEKELQPKLQCFFPILAAWAYSGEDSSNLKRWIRRLESSGIAHNDGRLAPMFILANRRRGEALLLLGSNYDVAEGKSTATEASQELSRLCDQLLNHDYSEASIHSLLETSAFCDALSCIKSFGKQRAENGDRIEARAATDLIVHVVALYQNLIQKLSALVCKEDGPEDDPEDEDLEFDLVARTKTETSEREKAQSNLILYQLRCLLRGAPGVYRSAIASLDDIDLAFTTAPIKSEDERGSPVTSWLPHVEGMVRNAAECHILLKSLGGGEENDFTYIDGFFYHENSTEHMASQAMLLDKVIYSLAKRNAGHQFSYNARILALVAKMACEESLPEADRSRLSVALVGAAKVLLARVRTWEERVVLEHILKPISRTCEGTTDSLSPEVLQKSVSGVVKKKTKAKAAFFASVGVKIRAGKASTKSESPAYSDRQHKPAPLKHRTHRRNSI